MGIRREAYWSGHEADENLEECSLKSGGRLMGITEEDDENQRVG